VKKAFLALGGKKVGKDTFPTLYLLGYNFGTSFKIFEISCPFASIKESIENNSGQ